ncbi:MAG: hypothetical protein R3250_11885 [Melioribacteraceae bacterium]|nr:hypothetical protein [Melioribacteraceae bacterium]
MEQAGINSITLYERKDLVVTRFGSQYTDITNTGEVIEIENCQESKLAIATKINSNNRLSYQYTLSHLIFDLTLENFEKIELLTKSIYGFSPEFNFASGDIKFLNTCLQFQEAPLDNNVSNSFAISQKNNEFSQSVLINKALVTQGIGVMIVEDTNIVG